MQSADWRPRLESSLADFRRCQDQVARSGEKPDRIAAARAWHAELVDQHLAAPGWPREVGPGDQPGGVARVGRRLARPAGRRAPGVRGADHRRQQCPRARRRAARPGSRRGSVREPPGEVGVRAAPACARTACRRPPRRARQSGDRRCGQRTVVEDLYTQPSNSKEP